MESLNKFTSLQSSDLNKVVGGHNKLAYRLGRDTAKALTFAAIAFEFMPK